VKLQDARLSKASKQRDQVLQEFLDTKASSERGLAELLDASDAAAFGEEVSLLRAKVILLQVSGARSTPCMC
jgi:hypothetical protein